MKVERADLEKAILAYWAPIPGRREAVPPQRATSKPNDRGPQFDPLRELLAGMFREAGFKSTDIALHSDRYLPGFYRPQKRWDLVVKHGRTIVAAFQFMYLSIEGMGARYGKAVDEVLGSAVDLRRAADDGTYTGESPWLGHVVLLEGGDRPLAKRSVATTHGVLSVDPVWNGQSYPGRIETLGRRLVADGLYDAVCFVAASRATRTMSEPCADLDWSSFRAAIEARIARMAERGVPAPPGSARPGSRTRGRAGGS